MIGISGSCSTTYYKVQIQCRVLAHATMEALRPSCYRASTIARGHQTGRADRWY